MGVRSRRDFLKTTGALAAAACVGTARLEAAPPHVPMGLQLYSVRQQLPVDFDGTLSKLHEIGYRAVEAAGYYDRTAPQFRAAMHKAGLRCVSTHHTLAQLETQLEQWIDYGKTLGLEYIVCSSSGNMHRDPEAKGPKTLDDWRWCAEQFNKVGEKIKAAGMTFGIHNHTPEFETLDGVVVYDELLRLTDPKFVVFEMDCGWVHASGHNPVDYLSKTPERFPLIHVKDMVVRPGSPIKMTALGQGDIDYAPIFKAATHLKYFFVEQERFDMEPFAELKVDADYIRKLNV